MMCSAYFGEISEERKNVWDNGDDNPHKVLASSVKLDGKGQELWSKGSEYFYDKIQIDWGSFAWKCTPNEILKFLKDHKSTLSWLEKDDFEIIKKVKDYISERPGSDFGVMFIEEY